MQTGRPVVPVPQTVALMAGGLALARSPGHR